jgi:hypothetical protein
MEDQYMEDIAQGARFDDTDDEEKDENNDSLVLADYEGDTCQQLSGTGRILSLQKAPYFKR